MTQLNLILYILVLFLLVAILALYIAVSYYEYDGIRDITTGKNGFYIIDDYKAVKIIFASLTSIVMFLILVLVILTFVMLINPQYINQQFYFVFALTVLVLSFLLNVIKLAMYKYLYYIKNDYPGELWFLSKDTLMGLDGALIGLSIFASGIVIFSKLYKN